MDWVIELATHWGEVGQISQDLLCNLESLFFLVYFFLGHVTSYHFSAA